MAKGQTERKPDLEPAPANLNGAHATLTEPPPSRTNALEDPRGLPLVALREVTIRGVSEKIPVGAVVGYLKPAGNLTPDQCRKLVAMGLVMVSEHVLGPGGATI